MKARNRSTFCAAILLISFALVFTFPSVNDITMFGNRDLVAKADAADGKGNPDKGQGGIQKGGEDTGKGGRATGGAGEGSKKLQDSILRGGKGSGDPKKGGSPGSTSAVKLGRLSMARAYLSPSFDPSKIDDPEAPLAYLDAYKTALEDSANTPVTLEQLATYLAGVATAPITGASILEVNTILKVTDQFTATGISADALATRVNELVKENREE